MLSWAYSHNFLRYKAQDTRYKMQPPSCTLCLVPCILDYVPSLPNFTKMKKLFFAFLSLVFISAQAQTVDQVIEKYTAAMGGMAAFNDIKTLKMTGTVSVQGMDLPITILIINGRAVRSDVTVEGMSITNSYKDGKGWKINPLAGITTATEVTGAELAALKAQATLASSLMDYKARGHQVELQGQEDVEGIKCNKIKLTSKDDGKVTTYYISVADNVIIKSVTSQQMMGEDHDIETFYSNIKEFKGAKFALTRSQKIEGQSFQDITFSQVEVNTAIDDKAFDQ